MSQNDDLSKALAAARPIENRRATAEDVAKLAGVSRSAVSRAYTPGASVAKEKRERIFAVAEHLGYRPNSLAAGLKSNSSNLVAIVTGNLSNYYDSVITANLVERLGKIGKWALVVGDTSDRTVNQDVLDVLTFPLDAMIIRAGSIDEATALKCMKFNVPLILSGRSYPMDGVDCFGCDNHKGARLAVRELIRTGRKKIAYIGGLREFTSERERYDGFMSALHEANMSPVALEWANFRFQGGYEAALRILDKQDRPDALFCCNDMMALGALNAAREALGLKVPEDLAIIGFDDIDMAAWPCFNLTTVRSSLEDSVDGIMHLVETRFADPKRPEQLVKLEPELIKRSTH